LFAVLLLDALVAWFALGQAELLDTKAAMLIILGGRLGIMLLYWPFFEGPE
jgi:hypothetical protein